eukprot:CAMPEP_0171177742 /NCGR_PEP_ID=MMETSP0790-20130122/12396_1 /TAXON_ID=2925 /ORGANISM="Alexandrium catenella, Strain OF101" /LENGTH=553 /DNA_ID=CAMNT_0011642649 /DNA_START=104 /DNA_END=1763 /DNA_ORIENTATION=-
MEEEGPRWEVVGGGDKGGIMVREGRELNSPAEAERLSTGALVLELELAGDRLWFERLTGAGPDRGWVSTRLKEKALLERTERQPTEAEAKARAAERVLPPEVAAALSQASAALSADAKFEAANDAFTAMAEVWKCKSARPQLLLARGLLLWRWALLGKALAHLREAESQRARAAPLAHLALRLCLSQWPAARLAAEKLGRKDVLDAVGRWEAVTGKMNVFFPQPAEMSLEDKQVAPGVLQKDMRVRVSEDVELGARLLLRLGGSGRPATDKPLVLYFHREEEGVGTFLDRPADFEPFKAAGASVLVVGYRGYGFSGGEPSMTCLFQDASSVCDSLPGLFGERGLPWPWPGRLALLGSSLGSRVACYLAGVRGSLFDAGVILETAWCGSNAPGARPPPEPKEGPSLQGRFGQRVWNEDLASAAAAVSAVCRSLAEEAGAAHGECFCHLRGSEDLVRGFDGRLLVLHGEQDMLAEVEHAKRLCDAAESATRKLVVIPGKDADTIRADARYGEALGAFLTAADAELAEPSAPSTGRGARADGLTVALFAASQSGSS